MHLRFDDRAAEALAQDLVQVLREEPQDLLVALRQQVARKAGRENVMMLLPGCRVVSLPRTTLDWFSTTMNDRFGVAMPYAASHG